MIIIAKNTAVNTVNIADLSIRIKSGSESELDPSDIYSISQSEDLKSYIESGAIVINDGTKDLTVSEALNYLSVKADFSNYYNKVEVNTLLNGKTNVGHTHDNLYYTETEIDAMLAAIETFGIKGGVNTFSDLPTGVDGDIYIVRQDDGTNDEGFYQFNGANWIWLSHNTGATSHNELSDLNVGDYQHLTQVELNQLTTGVETNLHKHDDRYYTEGEIDSFLSGKSNANHTHHDIYYTENEIDGIVNNIDFNRISSNDTNTNVTGHELETLTNGSNADGLHTHDINQISGGLGGLDDAYDDHDEWSHGGGRNINVDFGPVSLNASNGFAPLRLQEINYVPNQWLNTGQICVYDSEMFIYDATRSCWNSISGYSIYGSRNGNAKGQYLRLGDGVSFNDDVGWVAPWDGVVVSLMGTCRDPSYNSIQLRKNGNSTSAEVWFSNSNKCWSNNIDEKFNEGDVLNFYIDGSDNTQNPVVWAIIKRRI